MVANPDNHLSSRDENINTQDLVECDASSSDSLTAGFAVRNAYRYILGWPDNIKDHRTALKPAYSFQTMMA